MSYDDISQKWVAENQDLNVLRQEIAPVDFELERIDRSPSIEFKLISFMTQTQIHIAKLNNHPEQFKLNRYPDYLTFQPTRVRLGKPQDQHNIDNYINANFIYIADKKAIATQAPIFKTTSYNFWRMVDQYHVSRIFMLTNFIEKGKLKCDRYFPLNSLPESKLIQNEYEIELVQEFDLNKKKTVKIRKLQLTNTSKKTKRIVTHFHETGWTDGGVPIKPRRKWTSYLINQFLESLKEGNLPIVHCSAGVGRSGTFMMMALIRLLVCNNQSISIFNEVRKMRQQRWGMIQTAGQYEYLYDFAQREISKHFKGVVASDSESSQSDQQQESKFAQA